MADQGAPFIGTWKDPEAYAKLSGSRNVHNFSGMLEGWRISGGLEAAVKEWNVVDAGLLSILSNYRRAVCRIECSGVNYAGARGQWTGTGFLVGPNLLVTNQHVINSEQVASTARVDFEFERTPQELFQMSPVLPGSRRALRLKPSRLFHASPAMGGLDFAFIWIEEGEIQNYSNIPMSRGSFTVQPHDPIFIIHHPKGDFKKASLDDTELLSLDGDLLLYAADTKGGSSGAPVIGQNGKLVGLHHAFRQDEDLIRFHSGRQATLQDGRSYSIANEGIKFSAIAVYLESKLSSAGPDKSAIQEILDHFQDSDSITGPFGARGRSVESSNGDGEQSLAIRAYQASHQDIDVATWHMEWLNAHVDDAATLKLAATVFADITQDVWVLNGISRHTAGRLATELEELFEQEYRLAFAEEETHPAQPITAIFYNSKSVEVEQQPWPKDVEKLWRTQAIRDLELETLQGPIFPSFPACFKLKSKGREPAFCCNLVPLFVGQLGNAITRRAVAAQLMTRVVKDMMNMSDPKVDWLIVGDGGTPLRRTRLDDISRAGLQPIIALDRERGGFSYLRGQQSILSHLFVPAGTEAIGDDAGMVTVVERAFQGRFAGSLTGEVPYGIRMSLFDEETSRDLELTNAKLKLNENEQAKAYARPEFENNPSNWQWEGLGKKAFMQNNHARFVTLLHGVNTTLTMRYDSAAIPLSLLDLYILIYCEAGFKNGVIHADASHSLGERGLLPLPSNLFFWIGDGAPSHDQLLTLPENVAYYAHYLGAVKNKSVRQSPFGKLYRDLFRSPKIAGHKGRQAKLLAGIIHGYFLDGNYGGQKTAPFKRLLDGYAVDRHIDAMLKGTGYVHDGTSILKNRQANIDAAIAAYATSLAA